MISVIAWAIGPVRVVARALETATRQAAGANELLIVHDWPDEESARRNSGRAGRRLDAIFVRANGPTPGAARNGALRACRGDMFLFIDGSEMLAPDHAQRCAAALAGAPESAFASAPGAWWADSVPASTQRLPLSQLLSSPWALASATLIRRSALERAGLFDETLPGHPEWDLLLTLTEMGTCGVVLPLDVNRQAHDDVAMLDALRPGRHLPAIRRIIEKHKSSFERHQGQVLVARDRIGKRLWQRERQLVALRDRLRADLEAISRDLDRLRVGLAPHGRATLEWNDLRRTTPVSRHWGLDRGRAVDRHYIEGFIAAHAEDIHGRVLELLDPNLTTTFGGDRVVHADVLDNDPGNYRATIVADLRAPGQIPSDTYDCFILTQTLHLLDDMPAAVRQAHRVLKPGGVLLATLPCLSMVAEEYGEDGDFWRVLPAAARLLFEGVFDPADVEIGSHGNVLAATAFLYGLAAAEVGATDLDLSDPAYPMIVTVRAVKQRAPALTSTRRARPSAILLYHRVASLAHDRHDLAVSPEVFRSQLEYLRQEWRIVPAGALAAAAMEGEPIEGAVALTFDDGYLDNLRIALPILAELDVPATFLLTTESLERPRQFWWDYLERVMTGESSLPERIELRVDGRALWFPVVDASARTVAHDALYGLFKRSGPAVRDDLLRQIAAATGVGADCDAGRPMLADEILELARHANAEIGAHSVHHLDLSGLEPQMLYREVFECRTALERLLGRVVDLFAYPFGAVSAEGAAMVEAAGYRAALTCEARFLRSRERPNRIPRLQAPPVPSHEFARWFEGRVSDTTARLG